MVVAATQPVLCSVDILGSTFERFCSNWYWSLEIMIFKWLNLWPDLYCFSSNILLCRLSQIFFCCCCCFFWLWRIHCCRPSTGMQHLSKWLGVMAHLAWRHAIDMEITDAQIKRSLLFFSIRLLWAQTQQLGVYANIKSAPSNVH